METSPPAWPLNLMPADTPLYMADAWLSALTWAIGDDNIVEAMRRDTGNAWRPAQTPITRAIDKATGADKHFLEAFIQWFNEHVWGPL